MRKNGARALTANSRSQNFMSASASDPRSVRAAELTKPSTWPKRLSAASKIKSGASGVFEIRRHEQGGRPASLDLSRRGRAFARVSSRHHETFGAGARDRLGNGQAHALGRPGDYDHPPLHARLPARFLSSRNFGSEIPIVKFWKFHSHDVWLHGDAIDIDKWNFFAKIDATA